jgi:hypothetical protein
MNKIKFRVTRLSGIRVQYILYPFNTCIWLTEREAADLGLRAYLKPADEITPEYIAQIIKIAISTGDRVSITHNGAGR